MPVEEEEREREAEPDGDEDELLDLVGEDGVEVLEAHDQAEDAADVAEDDRVPLQLDLHEQNRERGRTHAWSKKGRG